MLKLLASLAAFQSSKPSDLKGKSPEMKNLAAEMRQLYPTVPAEVQLAVQNQLAKGRGEIYPPIWASFEAITGVKAPVKTAWVEPKPVVPSPERLTASELRGMLEAVMASIVDLRKEVASLRPKAKAKAKTEATLFEGVK